jgi:HD-GYP domain-containing protein (c-di-GMP phosphodiesterase class II)
MASAKVFPIRIDVLKAGVDAPHALYHQTATPVIARHQTVHAEHIQALKAAGIEQLYECQNEDHVYALACASNKQAVPISEIHINTPLKFNIYDSRNCFLLRKGGALSVSQYERMASRQTALFKDEEANLDSLNRYLLELSRARATAIELGFSSESILRVEHGVSPLAEMFARRPQGRRPSALIEQRSAAHNNLASESGALLTAISGEASIAADDVGKVAGMLHDELVQDHNLLLKFSHKKDNSPAVFQWHVTNVATLSMSVGLSVGMPERDIKELGMTAILHEVGMFSVPQHILTKQVALTPGEQREMRNHPVLAFNYLRKVIGLTDRALMVVYQEHEMPNRLGYPNQRPGHLIHDFAKILAICDAYEAMTSARPFRRGLLPYHAVEQIIKGAAAGRFDQRFVRAFLQVVGLFPVGSWVKLNNGSMARVISVNPAHFDKPLLAVLFDASAQPLGIPEFVNLSENNALSIVDVVDGARFPEADSLGF